MLYPCENADIWAKKYGIKTPATECPSCSSALIFNKPVAIKGYRGLEASVCECGHESGFLNLVPVAKEVIEIWENLRPYMPQAR